MHGQEAPQLVADAARHLGEGDSEAAVAALRAAEAAGAAPLPLQFMTALAAWYLGDISAALRLTRTCFDEEPSNGTFAEALASLYAQAGDLVESLYYGKLATALPPDPVMAGWLPPNFPSFGKAFLSIRDKPLLAQAQMLDAGGQHKAALDKARQHVELVPEDDEGRLIFGAALLQAGSSGMAADVLQPAVVRASAAPEAASLLARALADIGEAAAARHWHDTACGAAPDDAGMAAARIADWPWLGGDHAAAATAATDWVARFAKPGKGRRWRPAGDRLVIGYLVSHFADRGDAAAVAAVARAHKRPEVSVIGYGAGAQSWDENAPLRGGFDKWRDITGFDPATLAKTFAGDRLDIVIDAGGFAAPDNLSALARLDTALRVAWLGSPAGLERIVYDAAIASTATGTLELWRPACGHYPLLRDWTRRREHSSDPVWRFGSDARLCQIDAETTQLWRAVLAAAPQSVLLLRANDMARGPNIARLVERFGTDLAARIDIIDAAVPEDFYRQVDLALAPARGHSPRLAGEALACGVPLLALDGPWSPYAPLLRAMGLEDFVVTTPEAYIAAAAALAHSPERRGQALALAAKLADRGESIAAEIAAAIEQAARASLSKAAA